jgi:SNF2 family DNA or RNA helicase
MTLQEHQLFPYQQKLIFHQCTHPNSMLWVEMGLGKTVATLSSIANLLEAGCINAVLIVAPLRVCKMVWRQEAMKWAHTQHLTFSMVMGDKNTRINALVRKANIYLINYENLKWLVGVLLDYFIKKGKPLPFDGLVWDEIHKMKNSTAKRVTAFRKILSHFRWTSGLTGTPASNGYKDLHGQYLVIDGGFRLGQYKTEFMTRYYYQNENKLIAHKGTEDTIKKKISDITMEMSAEDYNPLPKLIVNDVLVDFSPILRSMYESLEKEFFFRLDSGEEIEVFNRASLINKLIQFSNGAVYVTPGQPEYEVVHDIKLDALEDIIEEAQGKQVLCSYAFKSDAKRIMAKFKHLDPINLTECKSTKSLETAMRRWKTNQCPLMIGHPASMGHGIDGLQDGGNIVVWYGLNWSLDLFDQFNARVRRQGQPTPVICHRIVTENTFDLVQMEALKSKAVTQDSLRKAVNDYRIKKSLTTK